MEATIIGCHGYLHRHVYLSLYVCHEALCGTVMVHKRDVSFLREGREGGGESRRKEETSWCFDNAMNHIEGTITTMVYTSLTLNTLRGLVNTMNTEYMK